MRALKEEESSSRMEGRGGEEGQGPSYKVLNSCFACPISFPASLIGERIHKKEQEKAGKEEGTHSNSLRLYSVARGPFASVKER